MPTGAMLLGSPRSIGAAERFAMQEPGVTALGRGVGMFVLEAAPVVGTVLAWSRMTDESQSAWTRGFAGVQVVVSVVPMVRLAGIGIKGGVSLLSDSALVCRGGVCTAERFLNGSGVTVDAVGNLSGVSVNVGENTLGELAATLRYKQIGVSTVEQVRAAGGVLVSRPTLFNPLHHELSGLSAKTLEQLFTPTLRNPNL